MPRPPLQAELNYQVDATLTNVPPPWAASLRSQRRCSVTTSLNRARHPGDAAKVSDTPYAHDVYCSEVVTDPLAFLAGGGEAARMIRARD